MIRKISDIEKIIIHCSDSDFGDVNLINSWHKARGWKGCGYHFIITNGVATQGKPYNLKLDGLIQRGRLINEVGAHCRGYNETSVGVCLIGRRHFTGKQLYSSLPRLLFALVKIFDLKSENIHGHNEFSGKTCPNIRLGPLREMVGARLQ